MRTAVVALALTATLQATSATANGSACFDTDTLRARLEARYGETSQSLGLTAKGALMVLVANTKTGTWTAIIIRPDGVACVAASGTNWQAAATKIGEPT